MVCLVNTEASSTIQWPGKGPVTALGKRYSSCRMSGRLFRATSPTKPDLPPPQAHAPLESQTILFLSVEQPLVTRFIHHLFLSVLLPSKVAPFPHAQLFQNGNTYYSLGLSYLLIFVYSNCCAPPCLEFVGPHRQGTSPTAPTTVPCIGRCTCGQQSLISMYWAWGFLGQMRL